MLPPLQFPIPLSNIIWSRTPKAELPNRWQIMFTKVDINNHEIGGPNEYMESEVTFLITRGDDFAGTNIREFSCTVRHSLSDNTSYENATLKTFTPIDLQGKVNAEQFSSVVETYYRRRVGSSEANFDISRVINGWIKNTTINVRMHAVVAASKGYDGGAW